MKVNFMEELLAEWYRYLGYAVITNIPLSKLQHGGREGEIDILAYKHEPKEYIHIEASGDANSWDARVEIAKRKFSSKVTEKYHELFPSLVKPEEVRKVLVLGQVKNVKNKHMEKLEGIEIRTLKDIVNEICNEFKTKDPMIEAVPESFSLLRAIQYAVNYWKK